MYDGAGSTRFACEVGGKQGIFACLTGCGQIISPKQGRDVITATVTPRSSIMVTNQLLGAFVLGAEGGFGAHATLTHQRHLGAPRHGRGASINRLTGYLATTISTFVAKTFRLTVVFFVARPLVGLLIAPSYHRHVDH